MIQRICVYCGSRTGDRSAYAESAQTLGRLLSERGLGLVCGGGGIGMMGQLANSVIESGGETIGVMPQELMDRELGHHRLTELRVVQTMHQRKAEMAGLADAFIALPGGLGTLEEIFEIATWAQLKIHAKPLGLLNVEEYFSPLVRFLDHAVEEGFLKQKHRRRLIVESEPATLLDRLNALATEEQAAGPTPEISGG